MQQIDLTNHEANLEILNIFYNECRCGICQLLYEQPITITCGHSFCRICITKFLISKPQCPSCLYPIFCDTQNLKENIIVKSISQEVGNLVINNPQQKLKRVQPKVPQKNLLPHQSYVVLYTKEILVPYQQTEVTLDSQQFKGINIQQVMKLFRSENTTLLANRVTGSNKLEKAYITNIQGVYINRSQLIMKVKIQEMMHISSIQSEAFQVVGQTLNLEIAKGYIPIDEHIEFNDETDLQIQYLLNEIRDSILIHLPKELNSNTELEIMKFIEKEGILQILNTPLITRNFNALKQLSYKLPTIFQINNADARKLANIFGIIDRLKAIQKILKKFETIGNPLMVFKIPGMQQRNSQVIEGFIICIILFILFYARIHGL